MSPARGLKESISRQTNINCSFWHRTAGEARVEKGIGWGRDAGDAGRCLRELCALFEKDR